MEKIIQINYQGRNISIEENAYNSFQTYENELKAYFLKEEGGEETFADLQYRMAEILEHKNTTTTNAVNIDDINELIDTIGKPSDLDSEKAEAKTEAPKQATTEKKKLYRNKNKNEKVIAGVCSGIAHYFSIDPIAVRLMFVLFTIFNIATLFSFNVGILAYIVFWLLLEPAYIKTNIHRKLFRNPKDKVLGGVCSGIAQFFNAETWVVRLIFIAPFLLGLLTHNAHFGGRGVHFLGMSFYGLTFISYMILWVIVPVAKSSTDYMLLKGEPINISTIQNSTSMNLVTQKSHSGISKFLKVIAYILIGLFLIFMVPIAISILIGSVFSYNLADIVLFTTVNKTLAIFTIFFFILLPLVGIIIWLIRKIAGYNKPNRPLRIIFTGLNILGWVSIVFLIANLARENNTYVSKPIRQNIAITSDTLFVQPMTPDSAYSENVVFQLNQFDRILEKSGTENKIKAVRLKYKKTDDTTFTIEIEKSAFGKNRQVASDNAMLASYETSLVGNTLYLPSMLRVRNTLPYHFQNVKVTIYVPKNKTLIISENLKKQLSHSIRTNHKNFEYHYESSNETDDDEIIRFDGSDNNIIRINDKTITIDDGSDDDKREAKEILNEAQRDAQQQIDEAKRELEQSNNEAKRQLEDAQREAQQKIDEAKRNLEESKREAQRKIDEAKRSSNK